MARKIANVYVYLCRELDEKMFDRLYSPDDTYIATYPAVIELEDGQKIEGMFSVIATEWPGSDKVFPAIAYYDNENDEVIYETDFPFKFIWHCNDNDY